MTVWRVAHRGFASVVKIWEHTDGQFLKANKSGRESCDGFYNGRILDQICDLAACFWRLSAKNASARTFQTFLWIDPDPTKRIKLKH
jgi:hypothetical protein